MDSKAVWISLVILAVVLAGQHMKAAAAVAAANCGIGQAVMPTSSSSMRLEDGKAAELASMRLEDGHVLGGIRPAVIQNDNRPGCPDKKCEAPGGPYSRGCNRVDLCRPS